MTTISNIGKTIGNTLDNIVRGTYNIKESTVPKLDKALFITGLNLGAICGAAKLIDIYTPSESTDGAIMMALGAALGIGDYLYFSRKKPTKKKTISSSRIKPYFSLVKTAVLATALYLGANELRPYAKDIYKDFKKEFSSKNISPKKTSGLESKVDSKSITLEDAKKLHDKSNSKTKTAKAKDLSARPYFYDFLGYSDIVKPVFYSANLAPKNSMEGRIQRTLRWQPIYHAIEEKRHMPKDMIGGVMMHEGYGDPLQTNSSDDGGFSSVQVQGTTAVAYGLRIYGSSNKDSDKNHGKQIKNLLDSLHYDLSLVQKEDERAHIIKILDTSARIIIDGKNKYGAWDKGLRYYRHPGKIGNILTWIYKDRVNKCIKTLQDPEMINAARIDFEKRNPGYSFDEYIKKHQAANENWGLSVYRRAEM